MIRTGIGFDVHTFCAGDTVFLGGVPIPFSQGLSGHSDADVLIHAVIDALLGASGNADIGSLFPDTDERFRNIRSTVLLEQAWKHIAAGWKIGNIDSIIICEHPHIAPYREQMRQVIADTVSTDISRVMVKATTTESLGFTGRKEGIAAQAIALIERSSDHA